MKLNSKQISTSTLLIPQKFIDFFIEKTISSTYEKYFSKLLYRYRELALCGLYPNPDRIKIGYQEENQNLEKINFRPDNSDWVELGILASHLRTSRTALFTWFLILDLAGWWEILTKKYYSDGVPAKISPILGIRILSYKKEAITRRKIYYKIRI